MKNKKLLLAVCILVVLGIVFIGSNRSGNTNQNDNGKMAIKGFVRSEGASCAALTPGCGYCPGEVADGACHVTQAQFDEYKKLYPELEADK